LLPKGREFNLSLGLIIQYPEQVLGDNPQDNRRAYKEILNNINTKIIGNVATDDLLADSD
jgi:DNA helicase HerA-like ATPase